jgi:heme-degrading monooxygenase HmoA
MLTIIWSFEVNAARAAEFERIYGSDGDWAKLFSRAEGYLGTGLFRDLSDARRYVTIDSWQSEAHFQRFKERFAAEYQELDKHCESLTVAEELAGSFLTEAAGA